MRQPAIVLLFAAAAAFAGPAASAPCRRSSDAVDVAIGLRTAPPFVTEDAIRGRRGLNFELWTSIEQELRASGRIGRTEFVDCPLGAQLEALADGDLDLVISPLTITSERMDRFDFTHQYLSSGITVAQQSTGGIDFRFAAGILRDTVTQRGVPRAILFFLAANLVVAGLMARALRRDGGFGIAPTDPLPLRLGRYTIEAVVRTIGLKGMGDGARSVAVRSLEIFMAVVGTVLSATIFGVLTTALVGSIGGSREITLADLPGLRVATLVDSTSQALLEDLLGGGEPATTFGQTGAAGAAKLQRISQQQAPDHPEAARAPACVPQDGADAAARCVTTTSWSEAIALLARGQVDVVLGDWAQLSYLSRLPLYADQVSVQAATFRLEPYGWGVSARRADLRAAVDRALMQRLRSPQWRLLVQEYMGSGSISPD